MKKIIEEPLESFLQKYQKGLEEKMRGNDFFFFFFFFVLVLHYHLEKINLNRGGSYIDSPKWLKTKKATVIFKNNCSTCFQ